MLIIKVFRFKARQVKPIRTTGVFTSLLVPTKIVHFDNIEIANPVKSFYYHLVKNLVKSFKNKEIFKVGFRKAFMSNTPDWIDQSCQKVRSPICLGSTDA